MKFNAISCSLSTFSWIVWTPLAWRPCLGSSVFKVIWHIRCSSVLIICSQSPAWRSYIWLDLAAFSMWPSLWIDRWRRLTSLADTPPKLPFIISTYIHFLPRFLREKSCPIHRSCLFQAVCWSMLPHSWRRSSDGFGIPMDSPNSWWVIVSIWINYIRGTSLGKSPWWLSKSRNHILKRLTVSLFGSWSICVLGGIEIWDCLKCFFGWRNGKTNHFWLCEMEFSDRFSAKIPRR